MVPNNKIRSQTLITLSAAAINAATYTLIGTFSNPSSIIRMVNDSDTSVMISFNGTTDNDYVAKNSSATLPFQTNSLLPGKTTLLPANISVYAKGTAGTGTIAIASYY